MGDLGSFYKYYDKVSGILTKALHAHYKKKTTHITQLQVMHSMSLTSPSLTPWVVIEGSTILSAHCDCIAGIGEVCSHVGAMLYYLTNVHHQHLTIQSSQEEEEVAVTCREQQWGKPNKSLTENLQQCISDIDYGYEIATYDASLGQVPQLQVGELRTIFQSLQQDGTQCSAMQEFCSADGKCFRCEKSSVDPD